MDDLKRAEHGQSVQVASHSSIITAKNGETNPLAVAKDPEVSQVTRTSLPIGKKACSKREGGECQKDAGPKGAPYSHRTEQSAYPPSRIPILTHRGRKAPPTDRSPATSPPNTVAYQHQKPHPMVEKHSLPPAPLLPSQVGATPIRKGCSNIPIPVSKLRQSGK